jgi:O-antigen ligase
LEQGVTERIPRYVFVAGTLLGLLFMAYVAYSRPGYFTSETYIAGLLLLELLVAAVCFYRRVFFPLVLVSFLFAGVDLPVGPGWTTARWIFLGAGAGVGLIMVFKQHTQHYGLFHAVAFFTVLAATTSAAVSRYPSVALLKAVSLLLLFVYAGTGVRVAVAGRENRFFNGLLLGCEIFVAALAALHFIGIDAMGNPNSLGAVMGVVGAPILLWGALLEDKPFLQRRRWGLYVICLYLLFVSHSRAGMGAACFSFAFLTLTLRKYKMVIQGVFVVLVLVAALSILRPEAFSNKVTNLTNSVVFKGGDREHGMLASRETPWQSALDTIHRHFWFGTGFGTTENGLDASEHLGKGVASTSDVSAENGSSYLAIMTWVGILGAIPFLLLVLALLEKVVRTAAWMLRTGNPCHPAVPLASIAVAGLFHAGFEDWLFAPGFYLCVFFWSLAFVLVDVAPMAQLPRLNFAWRHGIASQGFRGVTAGR